MTAWHGIDNPRSLEVCLLWLWVIMVAQWLRGRKQRSSHKYDSDVCHWNGCLRGMLWRKLSWVNFGSRTVRKNLSFSWVWREGNSVAHSLAKYVKDVIQESVWVEVSEDQLRSDVSVLLMNKKQFLRYYKKFIEKKGKIFAKKGWRCTTQLLKACKDQHPRPSQKKKNSENLKST